MSEELVCHFGKHEGTAMSEMKRAMSEFLKVAEIELGKREDDG